MTKEPTFPIIDISHISEEDHQLNIADAITNACREWGFLLLQGHPIPESDIEEIFSLSKAFFSLPNDQKKKWPIGDMYIGYSGAHEDSGKTDNVSMWFAGIPGALEANQSLLPPYWRGERSKTVERFKAQCHRLVIQILQCFALAMGLEDRNYFAKSHPADAGKGNALRSILYPARETSLAGTETRMVPHSDSGSVTLLFQTAAGLEVESPTGTWVTAPCQRNQILVNLGDSLSIWSGGVLKATNHRVTFESLPQNQARQSIAYFERAAPETKLDPIGNHGRSGSYMMNGIEVYPGITAGEYGRLTMEMIYGKKVKAN